MNRRSLLASAAALFGIPAVAKEVLPAAKPWMWLDQRVLGWQAAAVSETGFRQVAFWGTDRAGLDQARKTLDQQFPLSEGWRHNEYLTLEEPK